MKIGTKLFVPGVLPSRTMGASASDITKWSTMPAFARSGRSDWFGEVIPTEAQTKPSCVGRATAQLLMCLIRREYGDDAIPRGYILPGDLLWASRRRRMYYGDMTGGLMMDEGILEAVELGWLDGVEYGLASFPVNHAHLTKMLAVTPVLVGVGVNEDWPRADRLSGQIPIGRLPDVNQGHAITLVDTQDYKGEEYTVLCNSWGRDWGRYGYGTLTTDQLAQAAISPCCALYLPNGVGLAWRRHLVEA